ncbi:TPA: hypothetical protein ACTW8Y_000103 [Raoultella ornithinolytica]
MTSKLTITDDKLSALLSEIERSFTGCQGHGYTDAAEEYIDMISALRELQERRKAEQDSVHKRNPVLAYADSYRDMAKQGVESVPIWSVITDLERNIAPLYRHAQPAPVVSEVSPLVSELPAPVVPVVPDENVSFHRLPGESEYDRLNRQREWMESKSKLAKVTAAAPDDLTERLLSLRAQATLDGSYMDTDEWDSLACDAIKALNACRAAMFQAGNSPVIPDGYVMVPKEPTQAMCAAFNDSDYGRKSLRERYVAMLAAAPQEVKGE